MPKTPPERHPETPDNSPESPYQVVRATHLPTIQENLDSIRATAELATHRILDATEAIQRLANLVEGNDNLSRQIRAELIKIVQACSFQDLTGQHLTRVVDSIETIERSVNGILAAMGDREAARRYQSLQHKAGKTEPTPEPAKELAAAEMPMGMEEGSVADKQAEIDKMFSL